MNWFTLQVVFSELAGANLGHFVFEYARRMGLKYHHAFEHGVGSEHDLNMPYRERAAVASDADEHTNAILVMDTETTLGLTLCPYPRNSFLPSPSVPARVLWYVAVPPVAVLSGVPTWANIDGTGILALALTLTPTWASVLSHVTGFVIASGVQCAVNS